MVTEDFKLKFYFNLFKDYPINSRESFRNMFKKKYGKFHYLPELILMIENYQRQKYGETVWNDKYIIYRNKNKKWKER